MAIHINFIQHDNSNGRGSDYTFIDRHTNTEIAFGSYNNGMFEVINLVDGSITKVNNAGIAYVMLNRKLANQYGY